MTRLYHILPAADQDLDDQAAYLASAASLETALRFYDAADTTFGNIAATPSIGERWPSSNPEKLSKASHARPLPNQPWQAPQTAPRIAPDRSETSTSLTRSSRDSRWSDDTVMPAFPGANGLILDLDWSSSTNKSPKLTTYQSPLPAPGRENHGAPAMENRARRLEPIQSPTQTKPGSRG